MVWIRTVPTVIVPWPPRSKETDSRRPWVLTTMEATWWRFLKFWQADTSVSKHEMSEIKFEIDTGKPSLLTVRRFRLIKIKIKSGKFHNWRNNYPGRKSINACHQLNVLKKVFNNECRWLMKRDFRTFLHWLSPSRRWVIEQFKVTNNTTKITNIFC